MKTILFLMVFSGIITVISSLNQQIEGTALRSIGYISESGKTSYRLISAFGFFSNDYGAYLQIILSILINLYFYVQRKRRKYILLLILPTLYTLFFTFSRSATMGILVMIIFLALVRKDHGKTIFISSLTVILVSFLILNPVFKRWKTDSYVKKGGKLVLIKNISERLAQWEAGVDEFIKHPLIGRGFHTYHFREVDFESHFGILKYIGHAHNVYLRLSIESGVFGLASFIALIYLVYKYGFQLLKYRTNKDFELIVYIALSSFSAFLVVAMTESILTVGRVTGPIFTLIGLLVVMSRIEISQNEKLIHMKTI
ncbi:MAG: O-antigen ligase family protein [Candidatus Zhuqueibacterota bacterium]